MTERAYLLPDDPNPDDLMCLQVWLPNDPAFVRALFGSLDYLASWIAWERDPAKTGAIAAASMKEANEQTYTRWLTIGGCSEEIEPPYTDDLPDGRTPTEGAVDDWLWSIYEVIVDIDTIFGAGGDCTDVVNKWGPIWTARTGQQGTDVITSLCASMDGMTQGERDVVTDPDTWETLRDEIVCSSAGECISLFDISTAADWNVWLNCAAEKIYDVLNQTSNNLYDMLNDAAAFLTGGLAAKQVDTAGGGGSGFGFDATDCSIYIDFDANDTGYTLVSASKLAGIGIGSSDALRGDITGTLGTDLTRRCDFDVAIDRPVKNIQFRHLYEHNGSSSSSGYVEIFDGANSVWVSDFSGGFSIGGQAPSKNIWHNIALPVGGINGTRIEFRVGRVDVANPTKCDVDNVTIELAS